MRAAETRSLSRSGSAMAVVGLHALLIYAIAVGLDIVEAPKLTAPMEVVMVSSPEPRSAAPPPPKVTPQLSEPQMDVVVPETPIEIPITAEEMPVTSAPAEAPTVAEELQIRRQIEPVYPAASRRAGEEGTVTLKVLVDERGRAREVRVARSSGHARLDESAAEALRRWLFAPATNGSVPIAAWTTVRVTFRLDA